ncbi:hypothetical protein [Methyloparacoccus murrellii]
MRRYLMIFTLGWALPISIFTGINYLVDPYRIFHKPVLRDNYYTSDRDMRDASAGIINTEEFDAMILGSSMAQNFSPNEASRLFGQTFVNISMGGSGIPERSLVLSYAFSKKQIATVIFSLDWDWGLTHAELERSPIAPYAYLYDDDRINDILIYTTNIRPLRYALCRNIFIPNDLLCKNSRNDLESLAEWHSIQDNSKRFGGIINWLEARNNTQIQDALKSIADSIRRVESGQIVPVDLARAEKKTARDGRVFQDDMLKLAGQHPQTHFYLFFPPYSRLNFAILQQSNPQRFEEYLEILRLVVNKSTSYPNVHVFGFENENFLDDIANYKDTSHYHQRYNSAMLHWMKNGEHELTPSNIEPYTRIITKRAADYPLMDIGAQIDAYLSKIH